MAHLLTGGFYTGAEIAAAGRSWRITGRGASPSRDASKSPPRRRGIDRSKRKPLGSYSRFLMHRNMTFCDAKINLP
jgi:hypothetical protein